ncbi:MAG: hypothetical protein GY869_19065 [Planctomycetes bacterium]|nr:hypothetical protein [Planctomycetota bacterium]
MVVQLYLNDYDRRLPPRKSSNGFLWDYPNGKPREAGSGGGTYWGTWYRKYLKETEIFGCPSLQRVADRLIYTYTEFPDPSAVIQHAAYGLNSHDRARHRKTNSIYRPDEFIFCTDHAEPRPECGTSDGFHNNDTPGNMNLTSYRRGGSRSYAYRQIFRHKMRYGGDYKTGGRANILWLDAHVSELDETNGDDVPLRWYTGDRPK